MMRKSFMVGLTCCLLLGLSALNPIAGLCDRSAFKTEHHVNLTAAQETELLTVLKEINQLLATQGQSGVKYRLWKVSGTQAGAYSFLWDSQWPDRATYDEVHQDSSYKMLMDKYRAFFDEILKDEIYNHYVELQPKIEKP